MKKLLLLTTAAAVFLPTAAFAQSTATADAEAKSEATVVGQRRQDVGGVQQPDAPKNKQIVGKDLIERSGPGQNVLDTINVVPGVSFTNNDGYGNSGGTLTMHGFDSSRVSYTLDGIQLNDSGNYAIYSNFSIDPELIEQVNVSINSTDVDSPTASAVGGTINQRTVLPSKKLGAQLSASVGDFNYRRFFGKIDTGEFTPFGTRAFLAASTSKYDNPFNGFGKLKREQYNGRIYQPIGAKGDFLSLAGRYNYDRNAFFGSLPLTQQDDRLNSAGTGRIDRIVGPGTQNRFPTNGDERFYNINYPCTVDTPSNASGSAGADSPGTTTGPGSAANDPNRDYATCGTEFDRRKNPSNSFNLRGNSKFTIADGLVFTLDPSYQYTKANGGGTSTAREFGYDINPTGGRSNCSTTANSATVNCIPGYFGGSPYFGGVDLNGDGDTRDQVTVLTPSQTITHRHMAIAGLRWQVNPDHMVRVGYTYDHADHRQTGEVGLLDVNGDPLSVFPVDNPLTGNWATATPAALPITLQKRDRQSYAILSQFSGEYRGDFFDKKLTVNIGLRNPHFTRKLEQNCFTSSAGGFVECSGDNAALNTIIQANNPYTFNSTTGAVTGFAPPGKRTLKYSKVLPNIGLIYDITPRFSAYASFAKGISVPSTDNLYNSFYFPEGTEQAKPNPETTDAWDGGLRYRSSRIQANVSAWFTKFNDRTASAYDPELNATVYRNLGRVDKHGFDASVAFSATKNWFLYGFGSIQKSKIAENIQVGALPTGLNCNSSTLTPIQRAQSCAYTEGKQEAGSPGHSYGFSTTYKIGPVRLGTTAKYTGSRYVFDNNSPTYAGDIGVTTGINPQEEVFAAKAPGFWLVHADARMDLGFTGLKNTWLQVNAYNLFDKFFVGNYGGGLSQSVSTRTFGGVTIPTYGNPGFAPIGAPRTISATLNVQL